VPTKSAVSFFEHCVSNAEAGYDRARLIRIFPMQHKPRIEFRHVLGELSVNRNDPCEVLRELISNSYDAGAKNLYYVPLKDQAGLIFLDDGSGLSSSDEVNGITPWDAFFSIGKSTKKQGEAIGYKCQGSKLCFACARILVATTSNAATGEWEYRIIDNPRNNLDVTTDITPKQTSDFCGVLDDFASGASADTASGITYIKNTISTKLQKSATLIFISGLDTENYGKHFAIAGKIEDSYVYNYIRFYTRQGDVRELKTAQGFSANQRMQISAKLKGAELFVFANKQAHKIPFGYPYMDIGNAGKTDPNIKSPANVARLRDGRFFSRSAKSFTAGGEKFSIIMTIDGNRRAQDEYFSLGRKGHARSGLRLSDQRGLFISVQGIKICKYPELLNAIQQYEVMTEGDSPSHYCITIDGNFDLVTNRSALTKQAFEKLTRIDFVNEVSKFLDQQRQSDTVFSELLSRLKRESSEVLLNEQITMLERSKDEVKSRERFRISDPHKNEHIFLSPNPGEEYLVGVLYSQLSTMLPKSSPYRAYWKRVITFSTQGIDSLGMRDESSGKPLDESNLCAIEYKYEFNNSGPFNHALAVVDYIVAWNVSLEDGSEIRDTYTCFGSVAKVPGNDFEWKIANIENDDGGVYQQTITVISLRALIAKTFGVTYRKASR